jgi:hypothetical protein
MSITVKDLDELIKQIAEREVEKDALAELVKAKNKEISSLELRATEVLKSLEREEYDCPHGKISFEEVFNVKNPTDEKKHLLWDWMREKGIFDKYAQVHATSLKSLFKAERNIAIEGGADPLTFALPGMEPATIFEKLNFKPKRKVN